MTVTVIYFPRCCVQSKLQTVPRRHYNQTPVFFLLQKFDTPLLACCDLTIFDELHRGLNSQKNNVIG
jgi:hypothetical protein